MSVMHPEGRKWRKGRKNAVPDFCVPFVPCVPDPLRKPLWATVEAVARDLRTFPGTVG